jgi:PAS domain S-box-containing protein
MAKILVIDDEPACLAMTAQALRKAGYSVVEVSNASDALSLACREPFDLIISDICMEAGDGVTFLKQIRSTTQTATVPFIFMSGNADQETMKIGAEEDADGILPKPFTVKTLLATVERRVKREGILRSRTENSKLQLQRILEASPDLIGIIDPNDRHFLFLNSSGRKMLGCDLDEHAAPVRFETVHLPEDAARVESTIVPAALRDGLWMGEMKFRRSTGEIFPVKECIQAHREEGGRVAYLSVIAHDLSEFKRLDEERKTMELQLIQAHKLESIGQLAAGIAHEINTPTQYIGDNTRFLQEAFGALTDLLPKYDALLKAAENGEVTPALIAEVKEKKTGADIEFLLREIPPAIQQSLEGLERVTKIVRAMKDFSHPGVVEKTPIDINHAIESTVMVARNEWKYVADLDLNLDKSLPLVACVPGEFNQLILNLIVNAAHAIQDVVANVPDAKGTITVATLRTANAVEVHITDTGGGIPEAIRQKIFEPFFTTKQVGKGTGQGLAIARSVVAKHGGSIDFESHIGRGTTFVIKLPIA